MEIVGPTASTTARLAACSTGRYVASPANWAITAAGYVPAASPPMLTFGTEATPAGFVVDDPATTPFSEKVTVCPTSGTALDDNTALRSVVPPSAAGVADTSRTDGGTHLPITPAR